MSMKVAPVVNSRIWYAANLDGEQSTDAYLEVMQREFAEAMDAAGQPPGACLIVAGPADDDEGQPQGPGAHRRVFFSPSAISHVSHLIARYGATPCEAPLQSSARLLCGTKGDWGLLRRDSH